MRRIRLGGTSLSDLGAACSQYPSLCGRLYDHAKVVREHEGLTPEFMRSMLPILVEMSVRMIQNPNEMRDFVDKLNLDSHWLKCGSFESSDLKDQGKFENKLYSLLFLVADIRKADVDKIRGDKAALEEYVAGRLGAFVSHYEGCAKYQNPKECEWMWCHLPSRAQCPMLWAYLPNGGLNLKVYDGVENRLPPLDVAPDIFPWQKDRYMCPPRNAGFQNRFTPKFIIYRPK